MQKLQLSWQIYKKLKIKMLKQNWTEFYVKKINIVVQIDYCKQISKEKWRGVCSQLSPELARSVMTRNSYVELKILRLSHKH